MLKFISGQETKLLALVVILGMSTGQLLFKLAAVRLEKVPIFQNYYLWGACTLYAAVTLAWVLLLGRVELSKAYPLMAATYVLVPLLSILILGERIGTSYLVGVALIVSGIITIASL